MSLKKNISWTLVGNVVYAGCQWAMLVVLAKLTDPQTVGRFALGLAITAPVFAFSNLQLRELQATDIRNEYQFATYLGFRIFSSFIGLIVVIAIALFSAYQPETIAVIIVIGIAKLVESLSDVAYGLMQKHEQMHKIALSMMIKGPLSLANFALAVVLFNNLFAGCVALAVSWGILLVCYDLKNSHDLLQSEQAGSCLKPCFSCRDFKRLFLLALPLGIVILLNTLNLNIPRYRIADLLGEATLGYYSAISYLLVAGSTVVNAIGQSATPRLAKYYQSNRSAYKSLLLKTFGLAFLIGISGIVIAWLLGKQILALLYTAKYAAYNDVLIWTMVGALAFYCSGMVGCGISAARSFVSQLVVGIVVSCSIFIATYILVPRMGMVGGAIALCIGFSIKFVGQSIQIAYLSNRNIIYIKQ